MALTKEQRQLNPAHGWLGWWPRGGWRAILDPENARIPEFLASQAARLPADAQVLDASAGRRTYAGIFHRQRYESCDVPGGFYKETHDFECYLEAIPRPDNHYDAVILTQVLEHVPNPEKVLGEIRRVLKPGGKLLLTVPLTAPLHGEPWHFFHFTHYGIFELAKRVDLNVSECEKIGGSYWVLGKRLPDAVRKLMKQYDPTRARKRGQSLVDCILWSVVLFPIWLAFLPITAYVFRPLCYWMDRLDIEKSFTLGYTAVLEKPCERDQSQAQVP
jgi:SAM-dependent methyltransferase